MHKKLIIACLAVAALPAFVVAPAASAVQLTENGVTLAAGASITGTATEIKYTAGGNTITCNHMHMSGTVTANANGTFAAEIPALNPIFSGTDVGGDCTSFLGPAKWTMSSKLCLHIPKGTDIGSITGCGGNPVTTKIDFTTPGVQCAYSTPSIAVQATTEPKDAEVNILEQAKKLEAGQSFICPAEMKLDMEFVLTTTSGATLGFEQ